MILCDKFMIPLCIPYLPHCTAHYLLDSNVSSHPVIVFAMRLLSDTAFVPPINEKSYAATDAQSEMTDVLFSSDMGRSILIY